jgi:hypothetical protein
MERLQAPEELLDRNGPTGAAELLIAIASPVDPERLAVLGRNAFVGLAARAPGLRCVIAYPVAAGTSAEPATLDEISGVRFATYSLPDGAPPIVPWLGTPAAFRAIQLIAADVGVTACVIVSPDLAAVDAATIELLSEPILRNQSDVCMPVYATGPFDDLLNKSILSPLIRSLYGKRIRFPVAPDFALSARVLGDLADSTRYGVNAQQQGMVWPIVEASRIENRTLQAYIPVRHDAQHEGLDLSRVLGGLLGALFSEMEGNASIWQRVRGSQPVPVLSTPAATPERGDPVDVRPLIDSFHLGVRNLPEVWSIILPPVTLLELKHLTRLSPEQFRIPDALWVRIVYDFALAYRLHAISRNHILGALTPLYLGWVASYILEVGAASPSSAENRLEALAQAYEAGKPYLLSRWRWPDRFNP